MQVKMQWVHDPSRSNVDNLIDYNIIDLARRFQPLQYSSTRDASYRHIRSLVNEIIMGN